MESYKTAVIGDAATCLPFGAIGIDAIVAGEAEDIRRDAEELIKSGEYGVIFIAENLAGELAELIERARYKPLPSIVLIPAVTGSMGLGKGSVRETMKRAAGRDIMGEE